MPTSVHALAHHPLTSAAVAEFVTLPAAPYVPEDIDAVDAEILRRGWSWEHDLVCDSFRTAHGYVLHTEGLSPFGAEDVRSYLVFGQVYPVDPYDEEMRNASWLYGLMDDWQAQPGWSGHRPGTDQDCEALLAHAAHTVGDHLGAPPERTVLSSAAVVTGPALTHRIWRTDTHALILGPAADNGPYAFLTHLQLSCTPLSCGPDLPPADDEDGLTTWITAHVDW